jgi:hypothetical protein
MSMPENLNHMAITDHAHEDVPHVD